MIVYETQQTTAMLIFDLEDAYARAVGTRAPRPAPIGALTFRLVTISPGAAARDLEPPVELVVQRNPSNYFLFHGQSRHPNGTTQRLLLDDGTYVLRIESDFYQPVDVDVTAQAGTLSLRPPVGQPAPEPPNPLAISLRPNHTYPFRNTLSADTRSILPADCRDIPAASGPTLLRGGLHAVDGRGIAGARVRLTTWTDDDAYVTGESGEWVLIFPYDQTSGPVDVRVAIPGQPPVDIAGVCVVQGRVTGIYETALRGAVLRRGGGVGGATVAVTGRPGNTTTRADGNWFYYFGLDAPPATVNLRVTLPDGTSVVRNDVDVVARATTVVPAIRIP